MTQTITDLAYELVCNARRLDENAGSTLAAYISNEGEFRFDVEQLIYKLYYAAVNDLGQSRVNVPALIAEMQNTLFVRLKLRYDEDFKPNWVVVVSWTYLNEGGLAGDTFKETKLVHAEHRGEAAEKACNACGLSDDPLLGWFETDPQLPTKLAGPPNVIAVPFDEWIRSNTVHA